MVWAPICIPNVFLQLRNTKLRTRPWPGGEHPAPPPREADLNAKTESEGAVRSRGCSRAFPGSRSRSILAKVAPCQRPFPSPGCGRGWESGAGRLLPSASPDSLFSTGDEPSREHCEPRCGAGHCQQLKGLRFFVKRNSKHQN